jgi:2'-5' RNA ligase
MPEQHGNRPKVLRYWTPAPDVRGQQAERDQEVIAAFVQGAITAASAEIQTGGMIALIPDNPQAFTVPGGDPTSNMHMTLCFLGDVSELDDTTKEELTKRVEVLAADNGPVEMRVQGVGIWNRDGGDTGDRKPSTNTLLQPTGQAVGLRDYADQIGRDALGARYPEQFSPWSPHICAGYDLDPTVLPQHDGMVRFSKVRLALAGEDQDFVLAGQQAPSPDDAPERRYYSKIGAVEMTGTKTETRPPAQDAPEVGKPREDGTVPVFFPCLAVEGMETADGRYIEPGALQLRTPPLSLFAQTINTGQGGHSGAEISGNLTEAWKIPGPEFVSRQSGEPLPEGTFVWQARGEVDTNTNGGALFAKKYLRGNSVDLSEVDAYDDVTFEDEAEHHRVVVTKGFINASTLCAIPAFPDAYGEIEGEEGGYSAAMAARQLEAEEKDYPLTVEGLQAFLRDRGIQPVVASVSIPELGDACSPCLASGSEGELGDWFGQRPAGVSVEEWRAGQGFGTLPPALRKKAEEKKAQVKGEDGDDEEDSDDGKPDFLKKKITKGKGHTASAAALPPIEYFTDPGFTEPTPLTVDGDRIYGHIATWGTCHIGISKRCTPPPRSKSDYAYFNVGAKRVQDGDRVRTVGVGHLTMNTGHASLNASLAETLAHYDNTGTCAATVAAGDDRHGIWINGLVEPELSERDRERLAAAPPSGDWRPKEGALELCAVLAVNVPGYPVPRARVASGAPGEEPEVLALVAAGATKPATAFGPGGIDLDDFADRVSTRVLAALGKLAPELLEADPELANRQEGATLALRQLEAVEAMRPFPSTPATRS